MAFFNSAVGVLQTLVVALGAGLGIWGAINLLEGYGNANRAMRSRLKRSGTGRRTNEVQNLGELIFRWMK